MKAAGSAREPSGRTADKASHAHAQSDEPSGVEHEKNTFDETQSVRRAIREHRGEAHEEDDQSNGAQNRERLEQADGR